MISDITRQRLCRQQITCADFYSPGELVSWFGAMQAQDYNAVKWAIGLRIPGATDADIEMAIADRKIIRTWPMRGTLHFTAPENVRWLLKLLGSKIIDGSAGRNRQLGLNIGTFEKSEEIFSKILAGGVQLTRKELMDALNQSGVTTDGQRGYHILWQLAQSGLICFGPMKDKEQTFVLLDEWLPQSKDLTREESILKIAMLYFKSHGPATLRDFAWWTGLSLGDCRAALKLAGSSLELIKFDNCEYWSAPSKHAADFKSPLVHLLPGFDEYIIGYRDRGAILESKHADHAVSSNGIFYPTILIDGWVAGTWKRTIKKDTVDIKINMFAELNKKEQRAIAVSSGNYGKFIGKPVNLL